MSAIGHALSLAGSMTWEILWALILGFFLSAVVQAVIRKSTIVRLMGDDRPRTLALSSVLGAASSSCSYAAVASARALFRKGANFTAAMAFEIGSTNLVVELGVILALLLGWQFTAAEFVGGPIMIVILAVLFRLFVRSKLVDAEVLRRERTAGRQILRRLDEGPALVSELAEPFDMSLQAVSRHIQVLVRSGLVAQERTGRIARCNLDAAPLYDAAVWINHYTKYWQQSFDELAAYVKALPPAKPKRAAKSKAKGKRK